MKIDHSQEALSHAAQEDAAIWKGHKYFDAAEPYMEDQWRHHIWPMIQDCDFSNVVDLATGHGRNAVKLLDLADELTLVDILDENIDYCRKRFGTRPNLHYVVNDGASLAGIPDASVSLLYCFDAMVHFDSDVVRSYIEEFRRILRPGGRAFCHHSNYTGSPTGDFRTTFGARNFMSKELFEHWVHKAGLRVVCARVIQWDRPDLDCLTLLERPA